MSSEIPRFPSNETRSSVEKLAAAHKEDIRQIERLDCSDYQKAQLVLVLLGEQPAIDVWLHPEDDPLEHALRVLQQAGLSVIQEDHFDRKGRRVKILHIARTQEIAEELRRTSPEQGARTEDEKYGQLMGFPQTAIDAFLGRIPMLPPKEEDALHRDPDIIFDIKYSKEHWKEEQEDMRRKSLLIKRFAPDLYKNITNRQK